MSAPSIQDASWLSYSCRTYTGGEGGGGVVFNLGEAASALAVQDASWMSKGYGKTTGVVGGGGGAGGGGGGGSEM